MSKNKSAKDIAWDKERAKYQKQIRDLKEDVKIWSNECYTYKDMAFNLMEENAKLKDLLELDTKSLQLLLEREHTKETLTSLFSVIDRMSGGGSYL